MSLHNKYRPKSLDSIVGHEAVVTRLKGMLATKKFPTALAFFGPTSAGKTTLARAFVHDLFAMEPDSCLSESGNPDYLEVDGASSRSIEDVRGLTSIAKIRPAAHSHRVILLDEAQSVLSNAPAAQALLKSLESPPKSTIFIICSMDPDKFADSKNGKAIANRCQQFLLKSPKEEELYEQGKRILVGEKAKYVGKEVLTHISKNCNAEMRTLSNLLEGVIDYYNGLDEKPVKLTVEDVSSIVSGSETPLDTQAVRILTAIYAKKFASAQREIIGITDGFGLINKMMWLNWFVLNNTVLKGQRHPKVWATASGKQLLTNLDSVDYWPEAAAASKVHTCGVISSGLAELRSRAQSFSIPEDIAVSQFAFNTIQQLKGASE